MTQAGVMWLCLWRGWCGCDYGPSVDMAVALVLL